MAIRRGILTALRAELIPPSETWLEPFAVYAMLHETLARAFLAGPLEAGEAAERATALLGQRPGWLAGLAERFVARFSVGVRPRYRAALEFLRGGGFLGEAAPPRPVRWLTPPMVMQPAGAYGVPALVSVGELADWLCLGVTELEWLADLRGGGATGALSLPSCGEAERGGAAVGGTEGAVEGGAGADFAGDFEPGAGA